MSDLVERTSCDRLVHPSPKAAPMSDLVERGSVAVVVCREGRLPLGAGEVVAEAGGAVLLVGSGTSTAADALEGATDVWCCDTTAGPAGLAEILAPLLSPTPLVVLPGSPDGRDLAPRLSARLGRPLLAGAVRAQLATEPPHVVHVELLRADGQVVVPIDCDGPAVVTVLPGVRNPAPNVTTSPHDSDRPS